MANDKIELTNEDMKKMLSSFSDMSILDGCDMTRCNKCYLYLKSHLLFKYNHWKYMCAFKLGFKYIQPTIGDRMSTKCLICHKEFTATTIDFLTGHRLQCKGMELNYNDLGGELQLDLKKMATNRVDIPTVRTFEPIWKMQPDHDKNDNLYIKQLTQSQSNVSVVVELNQLNFRSKKFRFIANNNEIEFAQCKVCNKLFHMTHCLQHRAQCPPPKISKCNKLLDYEVIVEIDDIKDDTKIKIEDDLNAKRCFICNTSQSDTFMKIDDPETNSITNIREYIENCLDGKPSVRQIPNENVNINDKVICPKCLNEINNSVSAFLASKIYMKNITDKLIQTENYFRLVHMPFAFADDDINNTEKYLNVEPIKTDVLSQNR